MHPWPPRPRHASFALLALLAAWLAPAPAPAGQFWEAHHLIDVSTGSGRSVTARRLGEGQYELSGGVPVVLRPWYTPRLPDLTVLFLTPQGPDTGLVWGLSTGERGEKYRIDPALHVGFIAQTRPIPGLPGAVLTIRAMTPVFGDLREKPCRAVYDLGGTEQTVNCRLAAEPFSTAEPENRRLMRMRGLRDARISIDLAIPF